MSKTSKRRPRQVSLSRYEQNFHRTFGGEPPEKRQPRDDDARDGYVAVMLTQVNEGFVRIRPPLPRQ
ncbi:MAG: hypothetical protein AB7Q29_16130 [Vicinamibacterales bacterium]